MATRVDLKPNLAEILNSDLFIRDRVDYVSRQVVSQARTRAPRRTGQGATSIHRELLLVDGEWEARVSWDDAHSYMAYQEFGTRYMRPHSFLRPALEARGGSLAGRE